MRKLTLILIAGLIVFAGCGDDEATVSSTQQDTGVAVGSNEGEPEPDAAATADAGAQAKGKPGSDDASPKSGTEIVLAGSDFGDMLFDAEKQAIYIFENDPRDESVCYGDCAEAWPPVFTDGEPVAGKGTDAKLIGTTERNDGKLQVTYAGKPLYYYAHEKPGEVRCHNVNLNGGFWWVVGADGKRLD